MSVFEGFMSLLCARSTDHLTSRVLAESARYNDHPVIPVARLSQGPNQVHRVLCTRTLYIYNINITVALYTLVLIYYNVIMLGSPSAALQCTA